MQAITRAEQQVQALITPKKGFRLVDKLGATICFILVFAIVLSTLLNFFNFEKNYEGMVRSRYAVLLKDLGHTVDYGLGLGLSLTAMNNIPELIGQAQASDPQIRFIKVFDNQGQILYDTQGDQLGAQVPERWQAAAASGADWQLDEPGEMLIGLQLRNSFNQLEGAMVLGFDKAEMQGTISGVLMKLARDSAFVLAVFAALSILLVLWITRGLIRSMNGMRRSLEQVLAGGAPSYDADAARRPVERDFIEFQQAVQAAMAEAGSARRPAAALREEKADA